MTRAGTEPIPHDRAVFFSRPIAVAYDHPLNVRSLAANVANSSFEEHAAHRGVRLGSYLEVPFLHKRLLIGCLLASVVCGWLVLLLAPRTYESEAKMMLKVGRESVGLDPTATMGQTLMLQKTQEEEIVSALEVLGSRQIHETVVDRIGEGAVLAGYVPGDGTARPSWIKTQIGWLKDRGGDVANFVLVGSGVRDSISDREMAVRKLQKTVSISASKKSTVITIDAESKSPEMAQLLARTVTDVFLEKHMEVSQTKGSQGFFTTQSEEAEAELTTLVNAKTQALRDREIVSVDAQRILLNGRLSTIDRELLTAKGNLEQALAEIEDLIVKINNTEAEVVSSKMEGSDGTWSGMRQRIYELELQEKQQAAKYTNNHRSLIETREQLTGARAILAKLKSERVDQSTTPNPAKLRLEQTLQSLQTRVVGLKSVIAEQELQKERTQREVNELAKFELDQLQLDRNIALLQSNLQMLQEKREEARVVDQLQQEKISNVSVFQPATFVERPSKPNKKVVAAGFVFMGLMAGICLAFLREVTSSTIRTTEHVEANLRCPVVLKVPQQRQLGLTQRFVRPGEENPMRLGCQMIVADVLLSRARPIASEKRGKTLGVIGVDHGCGASTLASALAMAASDDCRLKTMLIDGDCQGRTVSKSFGLNGAPGLMELVAGDASADECVQRLEYSGLSLISFSKPNSAVNMDSDPRDVLYAFEELSRQSDLVIVDLPPASHPDQTVAVAKHLDHVIVVVESEKTEIAAAERLLRRLSDGNVQVVGVVLNKTVERLPKLLGRLVNA